MTLLQRGRDVFTTAPSHDELVMRLRAVVKEALAAGTPRDEVLAALEDLRAHEPDHGDVVLDVIDFVAGWSSPHLSLQGSWA